MRSDASRAKILIVEPDAAVREILQLRLSVAGHQALTARNLDFAELALPEFQPDLLVCDAPPNDAGLLELLRKLNGSSGGAVPVIVTGASFNKPYLAQLIQLGARDCLLKPFSAAEALERVSRVLAALPARAAEPVYLD